MLIAEEYTSGAPIVFSGGGPQVRVYTLHGEDAIAADLDDETDLAFNPTDGDWTASLPCATEDLDEVVSLLQSAPRFTVRDLTAGTDPTPVANAAAGTRQLIIDLNELESP